jgi:hypothetical protein
MGRHSAIALDRADKTYYCLRGTGLSESVFMLTIASQMRSAHRETLLGL